MQLRLPVARFGAVIIAPSPLAACFEAVSAAIGRVGRKNRNSNRKG
jgi:hypothetical protein